MVFEMNEHDQEAQYERMRLIFSYYAICSIFLICLFVLVWLVYIIIQGNHLDKIVSLIFAQPAVFIVGPGSIMLALLIVLLLRNIGGPIEFEAMSFKFRGASGPIVMWIFCYLALIFATKFLWL
jgi:hypothetical protein